MKSTLRSYCMRLKCWNNSCFWLLYCVEDCQRYRVHHLKIHSFISNTDLMTSWWLVSKLTLDQNYGLKDSPVSSVLLLVMTVRGEMSYCSIIVAFLFLNLQKNPQQIFIVFVCCFCIVYFSIWKSNVVIEYMYYLMISFLLARSSAVSFWRVHMMI